MGLADLAARVKRLRSQRLHTRTQPHLQITILMCKCGYRAELSVLVLAKDTYVHVCQACAKSVKQELSQLHGPCEYRGTAYLGSAFQG